MMRGWKTLCVVLVLMFAASTSFAAGFRLPEAGVKAMGMGFAFTAQADDPSAIYFNPAGLTQLKGQNVMAGVTYVRENGGEFTGTTPRTLNGETYDTRSETQKTLNFFIPNAYYTRTTNAGNFAYGVGMYSPFGLGQEYKDKNTSIFRNQATRMDLLTVVINPTIAFDVNEVLSVGAGIDYMYGKLKAYDATQSAFKTHYEGAGDAWAYNFGLLLKPSKNLKVGFNYRSPFKISVKDGDWTANDNLVSGAYLASVGYPMGTSKASANLTLPATAALGVAYTLDRLTLSADADWTFWSSYNQLKIVNSTVPNFNVTRPKNWVDVCAVRLGAEYRVTDPLALRAGFVYDPTPVPADTMGPELPDATRLNYMVGVGYKVGPWTIDGAFMYINKFDRTVNNQNNTTGLGFNGTWTGNAWLVGTDVGYKF
jgi:long-chain fatty acid transport protein